MKGTLSESFLDGHNDTAFSTDWRNLTDDERKIIADFIVEIRDNEYVDGKNKQSWLSDSGKTMPYSTGYQRENYWHYHSGPSWDNRGAYDFTKCMYANVKGRGSKECIHYYPVSNSEIIIVGFSRDHIPFIPSDDPSNPFFY
ncbi:hypothetical protein [Tatumella sp. OPLPL6]|uniref:hypothetical protein n=1 Tax=Tatumella sp. OPLPL6 TaxID=1928657 RepID=UPI000C181670|nr:hypothetical protein [Tatumella sp. OPLPL6]PIJ42822.1 hypothetical protein BOM24_10080 [Tatumella sp. OPLPL6]